MTPLDLSSLVPYLGCAWATGLIWVVIRLARGRLARQIVRPLGLVAAKRGASHACALSICAIATAAHAHHLLSHGVEGLVFVLSSAAMAGSAIACDPAVELEFSGGDTSGSADNG